MSELEEGTYWVALSAETAVALVVEAYWHDSTFATWGPAGVVMYGAVDSDRMRELSLSRLSLRLGGRPSWRGEDAPPAAEIARLWKAERRFRSRLARTTQDVVVTSVVVAATATVTATGTGTAYDATVSTSGARVPLEPKRQGESADDFYRRFSEFYLRAAEQTGKPLVAVCESAAVPKTTAARWAREARARGFLPETTRGKG